MTLKEEICTSDNEEYKKCMSIIKARLLTINKMICSEIVIPYQMLKVESIYLQFRLSIEAFYLSYIVSRKRKLEQIWSKYEKVYQPSIIRKYLGDELDEYFPRPYKLNKIVDGRHDIAILEMPINEEETYKFFNKCHDLLHEKNPYKKDWKSRESECAALLNDARTKLKQIWDLLNWHYRTTQLSSGEKVGMLCSFGHEKDQVNVCNIIPITGPRNT
jgi:hypothetical protein